MLFIKTGLILFISLLKVAVLATDLEETLEGALDEMQIINSDFNDEISALKTSEFASDDQEDESTSEIDESEKTEEIEKENEDEEPIIPKESSIDSEDPEEIPSLDEILSNFSSDKEDEESPKINSKALLKKSTKKAPESNTLPPFVNLNFLQKFIKDKNDQDKEKTSLPPLEKQQKMKRLKRISSFEEEEEEEENSDKDMETRETFSTDIPNKSSSSKLSLEQSENLSILHKSGNVQISFNFNIKDLVDQMQRIIVQNKSEKDELSQDY